MNTSSLLTLDISLEPIQDDLVMPDISQLQCYNPVYSAFLPPNTIPSCRNYGLNHAFQVHSFRPSTQTYLVRNKRSKEVVEKPVYVKYSPLLDPMSYLIGEYDKYGDTIRCLPSLKPDCGAIDKLKRIHNSSYVDSFFYFLSSKLYNESHFIHGIDFYGSYLGIQDNFKINIYDDVDYLKTYTQFFKKLDKEFFIDPSTEPHLIPRFDSSTKKQIKIADSITDISIVDVDCQLDNNNYSEMSNNSNVPETNNIFSSTFRIKPVNFDKKDSFKNNSKNSSSNSNNSLESNTTDGFDDDDEDDEDEDDEDEDDEDEDDEDDEEDDEDEHLFAFIKNFPCQMIFLEKCEGTLDDLLKSSTFDMESATSCLFQVIMTLIQYQKTFQFTHNDLHTNNIMYQETNITHLVYHFENKTYKVPTFGKIFKIIDFGRSIYQVNGKTFCSDSFHGEGDGHSQYNFEPFYNDKKPVLLPNMSFDLCRLGCSIYDYIIEDESYEEMDLFQKLIYKWCLNDSGKNVLYKRSGAERYPNFKLYKMIARTVHNHIPSQQLSNPLFKEYLQKKGKKIEKKREKIFEMTL